MYNKQTESKEGMIILYDICEYFTGRTRGFLILLPGNVKFKDIIGRRTSTGTGTGTGVGTGAGRKVRIYAEARVEIGTSGADSGLFLHTTLGCCRPE